MIDDLFLEALLNCHIHPPASWLVGWEEGDLGTSLRRRQLEKRISSKTAQMQVDDGHGERIDLASGSTCNSVCFSSLPWHKHALKYRNRRRHRRRRRHKNRPTGLARVRCAWTLMVEGGAAVSGEYEIPVCALFCTQLSALCYLVSTICCLLFGACYLVSGRPVRL
jgi:hypothetical protein